MIYSTTKSGSEETTVVMEFGAGTIISEGGANTIYPMTTGPPTKGIEVRFWTALPARPVGPLGPEGCPDGSPDVTMLFTSPGALLELAGSLLKVAQCALAEGPATEQAEPSAEGAL